MIFYYTIFIDYISLLVTPIVSAINSMGYTIEEIRSVRAYIKNIAATEIFAKKGGSNFKSLNRKDIEKIFDLYDVMFFQGQIRDKIASEGFSIEFYAKTRTSGAGGVCGIKRDKNKGCVYFLDVAPNILETIFRTNSEGLPLAAGVGCSDRLGCLQLIMEHEIVHLLMILWGYYYKSVSNQEVYGTHGVLFRCMIKEYFGHSRFDHDLGLTILLDDGKQLGNLPDAFMRYRMAKGSLLGAGFQNWAASCYLDSVLMVLFDTITPYWRKNIMNVDVSEIDYDKSVCDAKSKIDTIEKLRDHAKKIQEQIKLDYTSLHADKKIIKCTILRQLLADCLPAMKPNGGWVMFNTGATYDAIANIFPNLLINIPKQIHRWDDVAGVYVPDPVDYSSEAMLTMWDYMDPLDNIEEKSDYKEIRWDLMDSPILVFYNGAIPRIRKFNEDGEENGYVYINNQKHTFKVNKARKFGHRIIDNRYRLVGVVTLEGVSPTSEGGSHYTAHFLGTDEKWYYYNDVGAVLKPVIGDIPEEGIWVEEEHKMPSMYFYQKIESIAPSTPPSKPRVELPKIVPKSSTSGSSSRAGVIDVGDKYQIYQGKKLRYKKSIPDEEGYIVYFVYDETPEGVLIPALDKLDPITRVDDKVRMWRLTEAKATIFEEKLKILDYELGQKDIGLGKIYYEDPVKKIQVRNYTDNTFVISGEGVVQFHNSNVKLQAERGMEIKNLKHNIPGTGYVYHKSKLNGILAIIES